MEFVTIKLPDRMEVLYFDKKEERWAQLTEKQLAKVIPRYRDLHMDARIKAANECIESGKIVKKIDASGFMRNTSTSYPTTDDEDNVYTEGTAAFLRIADLFHDPRSGYIIMAYYSCWAACVSDLPCRSRCSVHDRCCLTVKRSR